MKNLNIRPARPDELTWINEQYESIGFAYSKLEHEFIVIAELAGAKAGTGRVIPVDEGQAELGGIYVLPEFRDKGIAREIVRYLISQSMDYLQIYCLPFAPLSNFYQDFGFRPCEESNEVPLKLREKLIWCNERYKDPVILLVMEPNENGL